MFGADHFHRAAILVEDLQTIFRHTPGFNQGSVERQGIVHRRKVEAVQVRCVSPVIAGPRIARVCPAGNASKGRRHRWCDGGAQVHHLHIQGRQGFGRRTGLAQISAIAADGVSQDAPADRVGNSPDLILPNGLTHISSFWRASCIWRALWTISGRLLS